MGGRNAMSWTTKPARPGWYWWRNPYVTGSDSVQQYLQLYLDGPYWGDWWHEPLTPPWEHPESVNGELLAAVQQLATDLRAQDAATGLNKRGLDWIARAESAIARAASLPVVDVARWRDALERIAKHTGTDDPENYRADDPHGCLDAVHSIASAALAPVQS